MAVGRSKERDGREIELPVRSRYPLIMVDTLEEERLPAPLSRTADKLDLRLFTWSPRRGLEREGLERGAYDTSDSLKLLAHIVAAMCISCSEELDLDSHAIADEIAGTVPLSITMAEKVAGLPDRARGRTVPAA